MKAAKKQEGSLGWKRFFVDVAEVSVPADSERRTIRSMTFFVIWVVGGLVGLSLLVWHILSAGYPGAR